MDLSHYLYLYPAYMITIGLGVLYHKQFKTKISFKKNREAKTIHFKRPWLEFVWAISAGIGTIFIGQLYIRNLLLPSFDKLHVLSDTLNQLIIFSPFFFLVIFRKQGMETAWIPKKGKIKSILLGLLLGLIGVLLFILLKGTENILPEIIEIYNPKNLPKLIQVFAEDFAIAVCLYRLVGLIGPRWATITVALLFAAGHIPAMLTNGASLNNFSSLGLDAILGIIVFRSLYFTKNFLWFWMIHYALDMTQYIP